MAEGSKNLKDSSETTNITWIQPKGLDKDCIEIMPQKLPGLLYLIVYYIRHVFTDLLFDMLSFKRIRNFSGFYSREVLSEHSSLQKNLNLWQWMVISYKLWTEFFQTFLRFNSSLKEH